MKNKVVLITGISSGIGKQTALLLNKSNYKVYGISRRENKDLNKIGIKTYSSDVTNSNEMKRIVKEILEEAGKIDILINNAGFGFYGALEDVPMDKARKEMDVNVFALAEMTQLVLPSMRKNNYGKIINMSSMAGKIWTPFGAWYHASKYAVEGLSNSLRVEVKQFGIDVILIEPGAIKTDWGFIAADSLEKMSENGAYKDKAKNASESMRKLYKSNNLTKPITIAKTIKKAIEANQPKTRYLLGYGAKPLVMTQKVLSDRLYDAILNKLM